MSLFSNLKTTCKKHLIFYHQIYLILLKRLGFGVFLPKTICNLPDVIFEKIFYLCSPMLIPSIRHTTSFLVKVLKRLPYNTKIRVSMLKDYSIF